MNKTLLVVSLAALSLPPAARAGVSDFTPEEFAAAAKDPAAFTVDPDSVRIVRVGDARIPYRSSVPGAYSAPGTAGGEHTLPAAAAPVPAPPPVPVPPVNPDIIVNIGKMIWDIIQANRPVVDVKNSYATAVPDGVAHWTDLAGWQQPEATEFAFSAKNMKGRAAIAVRYLVLRSWGGNYQGAGQYLTGVTIEPIEVSVASGYQFSLEAAVPKESIANVGTTDNPVAGMVARLNWTIKTVGSENHGTRLYYVQGDGYFSEVTGMTRSQVRRAAQKAREILETPIP